MSDLNSEIFAWLLVAKGETAGHTFRGNQYTQGQSGGGQPARQSDPGRYQVGSDRFGQQGQTQTTGAASPPASEPPKPDGKSEPDPETTVNDAVVSPEEARDIADELKEGKKPLISREAYPEFLQQLQKLPGKDPINIVNLHLHNTFLIGHGGKGIPRANMPQIPAERRQEFCDWIKFKYGTTSGKIQVNPESLLPIQNEVNGRNTSGIYTSYTKAGGFPKDQAIMVTKDGFVLDGHHNWAAAVAMHIDDPTMTIPAIQLNCTWKEAFDRANAWDDEVGIERHAMVTKWRTQQVLARLAKMNATEKGL